MAPASRSTEIAQPSKVRVAGCLVINIELVFESTNLWMADWFPGLSKE
jgi:hypothetical protein